MAHGDRDADFLDPPRREAEGRSTDNCHEPDPFPCSNRLPLTCTAHGETIWVRCNRRRCEGCAKRIQWLCAVRLGAGIENVPPGFISNFVTVTFPADKAPSPDAPHRELRSLTQRLKYRDLLGAYAWTTQTTRRGTRHYHGIFHMPWMDDGLETWRELVVASGFGPQNRIVPASESHAGYCARYITREFANLPPGRRVYGFSRDFPKSDFERERERVIEVGAEIGLRSTHEWVSSYELR